jgi:hypothetical protein
MASAYACREFPGMDGCPGSFVTATEEELWQIVEAHARIAHEEDPAAWTADDRQQIQDLIRVV